jgi:hypothetical protein
MAIRRGIAAGSAPSTTTPVAAPQIIGRQVSLRPSPIVETPGGPSRIITQPQAPREQPVRGLLVDGTGKPLRGLSRATIEAHQAHTENATELCPNCGRYFPPSHMKTVVANAYNGNNPLRLCNAPPKPGEPKSCTQLAYKDPYHEGGEKWQPSIPGIRFDRRTAAPYDARQAGVTISDLVSRDTYHRESEVGSEYQAERPINERQWSGGGRAGHTVTPESVASSRERAARVRR